jgi:acetyl-CoA C-acetyltransferase
MRFDPNTPVVVGVGQVTNLPHSEGEGSLADRPEPIGLMIEAVEAAIEDCDGVAAGGAAPAGRALTGRAESLRVANPLSWHYANPGDLVAEALGIEPAQVMVTTTGGNNPQRMVNATALAIGRGELDVAVLVGADCVYTQAAARRHPDRPVLPWTVQPADTGPALTFGTDRRGSTDAEEERGLDLPIHTFPLFENALRAEAGRSLEGHRLHIGSLWSRFSEVAAGNPHAWLREARTADEVATASAANRMIDYPYTKLLTANMQVDQGAAVILCSASAAEAAGVPRDRWIFPLAGADTEDHWFLSHRADFHSSPAIRLGGSSALSLAGVTIDQVAHLDLYSCFPSAVQIAAAEGEPAGHRQGPGRIVVGQAELGGGDLHGRGEARVEVEVGHLVDGHAGQRQRGGSAQADGGGRVEVGPVGEEPVVLGVGARQREDPPVAGDPGGLGRRGRAEDDGGALVDLHVGGEQLRVGVVDHPVGLRRGGHLVGGPRVAEPGMGVARRHLGEA